MAPGVGKTFRMLQEARELSRRAWSVVGLLETHGRRDTARQAEGLEQCPAAVSNTRGGAGGDGCGGHPGPPPPACLVDELAHTNVPGSERPKRWQDVEALLTAGIDVYSTVNIQHVEGLNDLVEQLTSVAVRERIPDRLIERADQVVLVDVTPETLQERLREGRSTPPRRWARHWPISFNGVILWPCGNWPCAKWPTAWRRKSRR